MGFVSPSGSLSQKGSVKLILKLGNSSSFLPMRNKSSELLYLWFLFVIMSIFTFNMVTLYEFLMLWSS